MSLSFDTLLEGTMIGAEASVLVEAIDRIDLNPKGDIEEYLFNIQLELQSGLVGARTFFQKTIVQCYRILKDSSVPAEAKQKTSNLMNTVQTVDNQNIKAVESALSQINQLVHEVQNGVNQHNLNSIPNIVKIANKAYNKLYRGSVEVDEKIAEINKIIEIHEINRLNDPQTHALVPVKVEEEYKNLPAVADLELEITNKDELKGTAAIPAGAAKFQKKSLQKRPGTSIVPVESSEFQKETSKIYNNPANVPNTKEAKSLEQSEKVAKGFVAKIKQVYENVKKQLTDPSIKSMAVTLALAIASYLAFYGLVKSSKGSVNKIYNIVTTFKAGYSLIRTKDVSIGKKLLIASVGVITVAFVGMLGAQGFNYMKNRLSSQKK